MIEIDIPGYEKLQLKYLVLDYNGTIACCGALVDEAKALLQKLAKKLEVHIITADTFGKAEAELSGLPCELTILPAENQDAGKLEYIERLGAEFCVCIGNGRNDRLMLGEARLGIAVVLEEGAAVEAIKAADVVCTNISSALELLEDVRCLIATLRS